MLFQGNPVMRVGGDAPPSAVPSANVSVVAPPSAVAHPYDPADCSTAARPLLRPATSGGGAPHEHSHHHQWWRAMGSGSALVAMRERLHAGTSAAAPPPTRYSPPRTRPPVAPAPVSLLPLGGGPHHHDSIHHPPAHNSSGGGGGAPRWFESRLVDTGGSHRPEPFTAAGLPRANASGGVNLSAFGPTHAPIVGDAASLLCAMQIQVSTLMEQQNEALRSTLAAFRADFGASLGAFERRIGELEQQCARVEGLVGGELAAARAERAHAAGRLAESTAAMVAPQPPQAAAAATTASQQQPPQASLVLNRLMSAVRTSKQASPARTPSPLLPAAAAAVKPAAPTASSGGKPPTAQPSAPPPPTATEVAADAALAAMTAGAKARVPPS